VAALWLDEGRLLLFGFDVLRVCEKREVWRAQCLMVVIYLFTYLFDVDRTTALTNQICCYFSVITANLQHLISTNSLLMSSHSLVQIILTGNLGFIKS